MRKSEGQPTGEKQNAEEELREAVRVLEQQKRVFDATLSGITDFAYIFDKNGRFIYSNRPLLDLLGITLENIIGKDFFDLNYPPDLARRLQNQIRRAFETGEIVRDETPFTGASGTAGFYEYIFNPVKREDGAVEFVAGSTRDVTMRKRAELNAALLVEISEDLSRATGADEIVRIVSAKIGGFLGAAHCIFVEVDANSDRALIETAWRAAEMPDGMIGTQRLSDYLTGEFLEAARAGETIVVSDAATDARADARALAAQQIQSFVAVPLRRQGEWVFLLAVGDSVPRDWRADEIELVGEITSRVLVRLERARAEEKLRESEERFRAMFEQANIGIVQLDFEGQFLAVNPGFTQVIGYTEAELQKMIVRDITLPEDFAVEEEENRRLLAGEISGYSLEKRCIHKNGAPVWIKMTATLVRGAAGEPLCMLSIAEDLTARKRTETALGESEERFRLLVESATDYAILALDENGLVNAWNAGAEKVFGYREQEIIGKSGTILFTPEDREQGIPERELKIASENGSAEDERWHIRRDGTRFYASGVMTTVKDVGGFVKIARDMTDKIKTEQIRRDKEMLQRLVGAQEDERRRIARDLHDELGQLMTGLRLKLEAVRKLCEDDRELCGKIDETQLIAKHLDAGIDFLAWELRPAALDDLGLRAALEKYVREWSRYAGVAAELLGSGVRQARLAPEAETNLYRIAQESLNNVHKHAKAKAVEISLDRRGAETIVLIIEDDGQGFDPQDKMNRSKGIGLIGMRERAALIGGTLEIESAPGKGTTVFVRVPAAAVSMEQEKLDDR